MRKESEMDCLAPPLNALLQIQMNIKNGLSIRSAIHLYLKNYPDCDFAISLKQWLYHQETGKIYEDPGLAKKPYRKTLLDILERGLKGEPVLSLLNELEEELKSAALEDLDRQIQKLPFISLIPLFLFQAPAFFLLLLAPLLLELTANF